MDDLGVEINLSKSLVSVNGTFEFAKRLIVDNQDVSPLSFKELDASMLSLDALALMLQRFGGKDWRLSNLFRALGYSYRATALLTSKISKMSLRMKLSLVWLTKPGNSVWSWTKYLD